MSELREEALEVASKLAVIRAQLEVDIIMSSPEKLLETMLAKSKIELDRMEGLSRIASMVKSFANEHIDLDEE